MPLARRGPVGWWSPDPRGVIPLSHLHISRSLRASLRRYEIRIDTAFADVLEGCADPRRPHGWITAEMRTAYLRLHELGWAHSIETWTRDGRLGGGLYGVAIGGFFAGESMFYRERDASKVAIAALVAALHADGVAGRLLDVQWTTPHLLTLGALDLPRDDYLDRLAAAIDLPLPQAFS
jgi:leucyl/phenylalanyl-tRNA--protein transferase